MTDDSFLNLERKRVLVIIYINIYNTNYLNMSFFKLLSSVIVIDGVKWPNQLVDDET